MRVHLGTDVITGRMIQPSRRSDEVLPQPDAVTTAVG